jgi:hypothetical protein
LLGERRGCARREDGRKKRHQFPRYFNHFGVVAPGLYNNQGPPACEEDWSEFRRRPPSPYVVDFTAKSRRR